MGPSSQAHCEQEKPLCNANELAFDLAGTSRVGLSKDVGCTNDVNDMRRSFPTTASTRHTMLIQIVSKHFWSQKAI